MISGTSLRKTVCKSLLNAYHPGYKNRIRSSLSDAGGSANESPIPKDGVVVSTPRVSCNCCYATEHANSVSVSN